MMRINFFHLLFVSMLVIAIYSIHNYQTTMTPVWTATELQQAAIDLEASKQNTRIDVQMYQERARLLTGLLQFGGSGLVLLLVGFAAVYVWTVYDKRRESWARAVDGTFALQQFSNGAVKWSIDPNKSLTGTVGFQVATGALGEFSSAAGHDRQLVYNLSVQKTRTTSAMMVGDGGPKYAAHAKLLAGAYDRTDTPQLPLLNDDEPDPVATWQVLSAQNAFAQSDSNRWILGQSPATGELFELNPKEAAHFGIVGATGTGKTAYTALLLMAYAMRNRYRVVVLDGKGGADWSKYQSLVEYQSLDYTNVTDIVGQMVSEYQKRQAILNQYGVNSIWELPASVTKPRPTLFIVDEFGSVMDSLKAANRNAYKAVELDLGNLLRLSRGAGLYVVLCDQNPSKWPGTVRANLPVNLCYRLGGGIGNAVQEYNLDKLERVGQFQVSNIAYNAFPTYQAIDELLPDASYRKPKTLLTVDSTIANREGPTRQNDSKPTPQRNSTIAIVSPVSDSTIDSDDSTIKKASLTGKPLSAKDKTLVRNTQAMTNSRNETCRLLWGSWTVSRDKWVKEILAEDKVLQ
jgi:hypothetical protein